MKTKADFTIEQDSSSPIHFLIYSLNLTPFLFLDLKESTDYNFPLKVIMDSSIYFGSQSVANY